MHWIQWTNHITAGVAAAQRRARHWSFVRAFWPFSADFGKFWMGETISNVGSALSLVALPLLVYEQTHSALGLAFAMVTSYLPYALFGLPIGALVDRWDRKRLMVLLDVFQALTLATIPALFLLGRLALWWVYSACFLSTTLKVAFEASQLAAIPSLVSSDQLASANGRMQASLAGAQALGLAIAGSLLVVLPLPTLFYLDAASSLCSAGMLLSIRMRFNARRAWRRARLSEEMREGLRYVLGHPMLRSLALLLPLVNLFLATVLAQIVLFAEVQYHTSAREISVLYAAGGVGTVLLSLLAGVLGKRWSFSRVALGALFGMGLLVVALSLVPWFWGGALVWAALQGTMVLFTINANSLRQQITPNHLLGRVISIGRMFAFSALPVGALFGGLLLSLVGSAQVALVFLALGLLTILLSLRFLRTPLATFKHDEPAEQDATLALATSQQG
jgi:MFS family permease